MAFVSHRILITGASGYLGGTLLARWNEARLPPYEKLYALVRTDAQADAVKKYGAEPLRFDVQDEAAVRKAVVENRITVVYCLINATTCDAQVHFIKALEEVKKITESEVHLLHTSGAKIFSNHAGAPTDRPLLDTDPRLYEMQKAQTAPFKVKQKAGVGAPEDSRVAPNPLMQAVNTNCTIVEEADKHGVRSYIFVPCIVYGRGEGFGNVTSIQTVAIVKAAKAMRRVYKVDQGRPAWPVCHVIDNTTLYIEILRKILAGEDPGHGKAGYYLASSGGVAWDDIYTAMAAALAEHHIVGDDTVVPANTEILILMGEALGCPPEFVPVQLGGNCTLTAQHGKEIGWKPRFPPRHIVDTAGDEVKLILEKSEK